ncbi:Syntaxin-5 like protein [Argiope bruennichi]|uniref:Syntaxin-5 like protein n=1 Tax=Argiope bruennichi TaxID=94029 RepID=A0A8T0F277_ARGBR|nr:Syntaxin-5 like protein [Argiope bruennichi]
MLCLNLTIQRNNDCLTIECAYAVLFDKDSNESRHFSSASDVSCSNVEPEIVELADFEYNNKKYVFVGERADQKKFRPGGPHFMQTANQIGRDLASTYAKLEKLTVLAKRRSLFADKPVEIEELTYVIKQDINSLNKQIAQLQESKARNNSHGKHMLHHSNSIVVSLQCKLANMSSNFREVLEVRTENLKHEKSRRDKFSGSNGTTTGTLPSAISGQTRSVLLSDESVSSHSHQNDECAINIDNQYQQQLQLIDEQDAYIQNRADTMQNIEATIVELGTIFQQLAHMVKEQEEIVQRIDANVEQSEMNIEAAHSEILKYFQNVTSNRWLMIKVFAVLISKVSLDNLLLQSAAIIDLVCRKHSLSVTLMQGQPDLVTNVINAIETDAEGEEEMKVLGYLVTSLCAPQQKEPVDKRYSQNLVADALSRIEIDPISQASSLIYKDIASAQLVDDELKRLLQSNLSSLLLKQQYFPSEDIKIRCLHKCSSSIHPQGLLQTGFQTPA